MIEGGNPGGSALAQASQRRATADRLVTEAKWLETVAADERQMAAQLANLPETYTILHDLRVPGSRGNIDHVVIGPGGAFLIVTRRHDEGVAFRDQQLFAGGTPLKGELDAARQEAQLLTHTLGTPVVPVIGLLGAPVPTSVPAAIEGVLVCAGENVDRVVSRGSHTLLPTPKIAEAAERALPLLNTPGTTPRVLLNAANKQVGSAERSAPIPPPVVAAMSAASLPAPAAPAASPAAPDTKAAKRAERAQQQSVASAQQQERRRGTGDSGQKPPRERSGGKRSAAFVAASIGSLCLVAFAAGSLVRVLSGDDKPATAPLESIGGESTTTIFIDASSTVAPATTVPVAFVAPPVVGFTPLCPTPGGGWQLVPTWPGDVAGLATYDVQIQQPDGSWQTVSSFATPDTAVASINGQGPNVTIVIQFIAVLADGSRSPGTPTAVITPATAC